MTTIEKIRAEIEEEARIHTGLEEWSYYVKGLMTAKDIIDKYASEECDRDCEHCTWIECPKDDYQTDMDEAWEQAKKEPCEVSEYDKDHIWYKGHQYISLRRFLEVKAEAYKEPSEDATLKDIFCMDCEYKQEQCDTISYNDDFATALEKISKYEDRKTERMENALNHIRTAVDVDEWAVKEVERVFENYDEMRMMLAETEYAKEHETCEGCEHPCIMYEPKMKACERKHECEEAVGRQASLNTIESMYQKCDGDLQTYHDLLVDCFEVLPSIQPKAKTGRWIERGDDRFDWLVCSECEFGSEGEVKCGEGTNYCPSCGARMVDE